MIITLVVDQYGAENNGTTISARRLASNLASRGHEVRVVGVTNDNPSGNEILYSVPERRVPLATYFAHKQGMLFAKPDKDILDKAITGADVVHVLMPFKFEKTAMLMAKKKGIPVTGAFHVQAENVTTQLGLVNSELANHMVYKLFRKSFYKHLNYIHCPSNMIANELKNNGYEANFCVISNGTSNFCIEDIEKPDTLKDKFVILSIGRLSHEKRHDLTIEAISKSKYKDNIQLIIAGKGPLKDEIVEKGKILPNPPIIDFFTRKGLNKIINYSDLYVHPAEIEIEGMSIVEALGCGKVPIVSDSPKSATIQFALDDRSVFKHGNSDDLAQKIDYFIEHEEERKLLAPKYIEHSKEYSIDRCIDKMEQMFLDAIKDKK